MTALKLHAAILLGTLLTPLSSFGAATQAKASSTQLTNAHAYPVPFIASRGDSLITFTDLSSIATIRIYASTGQLIKTLHESDGDGQASWDIRDENGNLAISSIYLFQIESATDFKQGKLIVIR